LDHIHANHRGVSRAVVLTIVAVLVATLVTQNVPLRVAAQLALPIAKGFSSYAAAASAAGTTRASVNAAGAAGTSSSLSSLQNMSGDGRYVVFPTSSANFPSANGFAQVYLRDRTLGTTSLVSVSTSGTAGNGSSMGDVHATRISNDGRYVAFYSGATNLVPSPPTSSQLYVRDLTAGVTVVASVSTGGDFANANVIDFAIANGYVAFETNASNLVAGDDATSYDVFLRDLAAGTTTRISQDSSGASGGGMAPSISANGRYVAFISGGNFVPGVTDHHDQIYLHDRTTGQKTLVTAGDGSGADDFSYYPAVADDGSVVFGTDASNLGIGGGVGVDHTIKLAHYAAGGGITALSVGNPGSISDAPYISPNGRFVLSWVQARVYLTDMLTGAVELESISSSGEVGVGCCGDPGDSEAGAVSNDGEYVSFTSYSSNLVPGKANALFDFDIFVHDRGDQDVGADFPYTFGANVMGARSADPVSIATGVFTNEVGDLAMPGRGLGFSFARSYNSADTLQGPLGPAWTHSYNWRVIDAGLFVDVRRGDGRRDHYSKNADGTYVHPPNVFDLLVKNVDNTYTFTLTNQVVYEFSTSGALTRIHEPAGNQLAFAYTSGNLTTITDSGGRTVSLSYDTSNRITQVQDPLARNVTYGYDSNGRLATVTDKIGNGVGPASAHRWLYAYDGSTLHLTTITDPDGHVRVTNTYDAQGRVYQQRDGLSKLTTFDYSTPGQTVVTDPRGHATTYTFDERQRLLTQSDLVDMNTYLVSYVYDPTSGNRTSVTDRDGQTTNFTYDTAGNVKTRTDPQVDPLIPRYVTQFDYDTKNNLTVVTDPRTFTTSNAYDAATNVLLSVTRQIDATTFDVTKYEYADATNPGLPTKVIAPRGNLSGTPDYTYATTLSYDIKGNLVTRIDPDGAKTTYAYDLAGRMTSFVDPDGYAAGATVAEHTWLVGYDENDQEKTRTDPLGKSVQYAYDGAGNRTSLTDRDGNITTYTYDANARLATVLQKPNPVGQPTLVYTTTVGRDDNGNATHVTQGNNVVTDYGFDALDRMISSTTHPDGVTSLVTGYVLDGNGNVLTKTTADGTVVTNTYDAVNRLKSVASTGLTTIAYDYDPSGNRLQMVDGTGTTSYQYDGLGRLTQGAQPNGTLGYAYDRDGNRTTLTYPGTTGAVTYTYTPGGRLDHLVDWASRTSTYTYTASGLVASLLYPNGMKATYAYDRSQRLTTVFDGVGTTIVNREVYTLDAEGNRTALDEYVPGISAVPTTTWAASVKVNSDTGTTVQDHPQIAIAADGSTYLVWDDARAGNADIEFSRRNPSTGLWDANVKVNKDTGTRIQLNPAVSTDGASSAYVVWQDERNGAGKPDIYYQKRTSAGTWLANDLKLNDDAGGGGGAVQRNPRIAGKADGDQTAVWVDLRSSQNNIWSSTLIDGTGSWTTNKLVTVDNSTALKDFPDVAMGADGTSYAVWQDSRSGNADIYFSSLPPGGSTWSANVKVSDDPGAAAQRAPRIGVDGAGNLTVVWLDDRVTPTTIRMSRRLAGSSIWSASSVVNDAAARPLSVAIAVRADGMAQVVFGDNRGTSNDIYRSEYDPWLAQWSTVSTLASDDPGAAAQQAPTVAYSTTELFAAWRDDRAGNANAQARRAALAGGAEHFGYTYDGLNRLTAVAGPVAETFTLDAATNISTRTGPTASYTYDTSNRLTGDGAQTFTWNNADRLAGRGSDTFGYDPLGRLVSSVTGGSTRTFAYSGDGLLQSATQGTAKFYVWDIAMSPPSLLQAGTDSLVYGLGPLYGVHSDGTMYAFARDVLGSVRAEVNSTGGVTKSFRYRAYGTVAASSGGSPTLLSYTGELADANGLIYLRARWYDPVATVFLSRDARMGGAQQPGSLNAFIYASRRPTFLVDPSGLEPSAGGNWAYAIAGIFRDLDSSDHGTQISAIARLSIPAVIVAIPLGIAVTPVVVGAPVAAATAGTGAMTLLQRLQSANIDLSRPFQEFQGGLVRARLLFDYLTEGASDFASAYPGVMKQFADASRVGLRVQGGKPPTIDLHEVPGALDGIELKFLH
jgi:RHS repeat-associated protein